MEGSKEHGGGGVRIDHDKFAKALERISSEAGVRAELQKDPAKALENLGIHVSDHQRAELAGKRLSELIGEGDAAMIVAPLVRVATGGTRPVINVAVSSAVFADIDNTMKELSQSKGKG
jgi:hypothetical protein